MPSFRTAEVIGILSQRPGLQRLAVRLPEADARAYVLTQLTGECAVGDEVVLNTTAVELGLGTGGWHVVHWNASRRDFVSPGPDHIMKLRYTSLQFDAGTAELDHPEVDDPLGGIPVVACSVHSQLAAVAAGYAEAGGQNLVYVMTDGAALPLALSDLVVTLRDRGLITATVTAGHAFGGDLEAVNVASALGLAAHVADAEAIVVAMGPGVVGTGTELGTTGIEVASVLDTAAARGATPILCVRASSGDPRERHRGVSHHVATSLSLMSAEPLVAPVPEDVRELEQAKVFEAGPWPDPVELFATYDLRVTTMGRSVEEDRLFFAAAAAAGRVAAGIAARR